MKVFERYFRQNQTIARLEFPDNLELIVIIPVFDDPDIFATIDSLCRCDTNGQEVGVVIVVNHSETCQEEMKISNRLLFNRLRLVLGGRKDCGLFFELIGAFDLPAKSAGVGYARKIAMDAASAYFYEYVRPEGVIASLDADTLVEENYFTELIRFFRSHPVAGVSIAYEHRLDDPECTGVFREAMIKYELYLRYYQLALKFCGHPHFWHCIGSAFAVRAEDYVAQGGMNKRQAGEDFYFIQKLICTGRYADLCSTKVYPSARISARTPFGTGQSLQQIVADEGNFPVYDFAAFRMLKSFFALVPGLYRADAFEIDEFCRQQPSVLAAFLLEMDFTGVIDEVNGNCASERQFVRRFFDHFNAFRVLKYLNYVHQHDFVRMDVVDAMRNFFADLGVGCPELPEEILEKVRKN